MKGEQMIEYTGKYEVSKEAPKAWAVYAVCVGGAWERVAVFTSEQAAKESKAKREAMSAALFEEHAKISKVPQ